MRYIYLFALILIFVSSSVLNVFAAESFFTDVPSTHKNYYAIKYLKEQNIINGISEDKFDPDTKVNRASALKIILKGLEIYDADMDNSGFDIYAPVGFSYADIMENAWFVPYVRYASKNNIVSGYEDGTFKPERMLNLAEALKIIINTFDEDAVKNIKVENAPFKDVPQGSWFAKYFQYAKDRNLLVSDDDGNIFPADAISRGELVEIIFRLRIIKEKKLDTYDLSVTWQKQDFPKVLSRIAIPPDWQKKDLGEALILWRNDKELDQTHFLKLYPKTARIIISLDNPNQSSDSYFSKVLKTYDDKPVYRKSGNRLTIDGKNYYHEYFYYDKNTVVVKFLDVGQSILSEQNLKLGKSILNTFEKIEPNVEKEEEIDVLAIIRENIHVDGSGMKSINLIKDAAIIHTDAMGVGTGPVDYYYSEKLNTSIKYERSFDVILDIREDKTYKF